MVTDGYLPAAAAAGYAASPAYLPPQAAEPRTRAAAYRTVVRREIRRLLGPRAPSPRTARTHCARLGRSANRRSRSAGGAASDRRTAGSPWARARLSAPEVEAFLRRAPGLPSPAGHDDPPAPAPGSCFPAVLGRAGLNELRAASWSYRMRDDQREVLVHAGERGPERLRETVRARRRSASMYRREWRGGLDPAPRAEGAVVVIENQTGYVRAIVGGYRDTLEGFVRATQATPAARQQLQALRLRGGSRCRATSDLTGLRRPVVAAGGQRQDLEPTQLRRSVSRAGANA